MSAFDGCTSNEGCDVMALYSASLMFYIAVIVMLMLLGELAIMTGERIADMVRRVEVAEDREALAAYEYLFNEAEDYEQQ